MGDQLRVVVMNSFNHDYASAFRTSLARLGLQAEVIDLPNIELADLTPGKVRHIRHLLTPSAPEQIVIFCPGIMEMFIDGPHHSVHFSVYRAWHDEGASSVLPHPWSVHAAPPRAAIAWTEKPALRAGFMGSIYDDAALVRLGRRLPRPIKRWLLTGRYLRHARMTACAYASGLPVRFALAFPRVEALEALERQAADQDDFDVRIIGTGGFTGLPDAKARYVDEMIASTYVLCPRGSENFSFRVYEAFLYGRVPVIIDTDMVLPSQIPWRDLALIIPYDGLDGVAQSIRDDYERTDAARFIARQRAALDLMQELGTGYWLDEALGGIVRMRRAARETTSACRLRPLSI
ncbi:exostosin family protein [Sphingomonas sp.]|uniref:exostosin domain-containing protein n=1 Tax=Sphingomonas sp. TaxID=28214 RepID=UPI002585B711|nr:exostosin family protein [Sphingomonas sp.]